MYGKNAMVWAGKSAATRKKERKIFRVKQGFRLKRTYSISYSSILRMLFYACQVNIFGNSLRKPGEHF